MQYVEIFDCQISIHICGVEESGHLPIIFNILCQLLKGTADGLSKTFAHLERFQNLALDLIFPINQIELGGESRRYSPMVSAEGEKNTRVGTLIVATIYLHLIQNRYMFRSFTVLQCSHQHCVQPVASDAEVVGYL